MLVILRWEPENFHIYYIPDGADSASMRFENCYRGILSGTDDHLSHGFWPVGASVPLLLWEYSLQQSSFLLKKEKIHWLSSTPPSKKQNRLKIELNQCWHQFCT